MAVKTLPACGPPPRAWGQRAHGGEDLAGLRSTPTCVGTTRATPTRRRRGGVHPHVRGDNRRICERLNTTVGPPPRAWGQRWRPRQPKAASRSTPTCVGTTRPYRLQMSRPPVHPHVRGDNPSMRSSASLRSGPPPRAWGQLGRVVRRTWHWRSTPTCVGTTRRLCPHAPTGTVHPHVRGDNAPPETPTNLGAGPPPRAWGQRVGPHRRRRVERSTPTCVGTTPLLGLRRLVRQVHPHVRGDNTWITTRYILPSGPPPRAWGQLDEEDVLGELLRSTPTCVGTTAERSARRAAASVHPHVRGDNATAAASSVFPAGPPPRAWGQHVLSCRPDLAPRSTPTCVGTTGRVRAQE